MSFRAASRASDRHALRAAAHRRNARGRPCVPVAGIARPDRRAVVAAGRAGRSLSRHHRLLSDARHACRVRHPRRRRRGDGRRHHPGRQRLRHLVRRAVSERPRAHGRRRRRRGQAAPLDSRRRVAHRVRVRQPPASPHAAIQRARRRGDLPLRREGIGRRCGSLRAPVHRRRRRRARFGPDRPRARQSVAAARLHRRRQSLHRDAGRSRRRLGVGHDPLRQPRLRLADRESLLPRRRGAARLAEESPRGIVAARRRAARTRILGPSQLGGELRRREPAHHRARRPASARGRLLRDG